MYNLQKLFMKQKQKSKIKIIYEKDDDSNGCMSALYAQKSRSEGFLTLDKAIGQKRNEKKKKKYENLRRIIVENKVKMLTKNFIKKLQMNSIFRRPIENEDIKEDAESLSLFQKAKKRISESEGMNLSNFALMIWAFTNIIQITFMVFVITIVLAFPETNQFPTFVDFRIGSITLYVIDMILNFFTQRYEKGKQLIYIGKIAEYYIHNQFIIDLINILILQIEFYCNSKITIIISLVAVVKLANNIKKFQKFQHLFITSSEKEQYYGLIKVFITNFAIGHLLSISLNLMARIEANNWQTKLNIENSEWYIKYIWGYYWGTNIMLTVGFGDLVAANYYEAVILIFIETFSCITLAYNISYVGALIGSIRQNEVSKKKKLKTFHRMCKQNQVPSEIETKVCNFIEESYQIKEQFENDSHIEVLESLPKSMQRQYRIEANKILFDGLGFLSNLSKKSLLSLAQEINRKICHPEEILIRKGSISDFMILQKGTLSFICKIRSQLDGKIIESLNVNESDKPKILSLDFIQNKVITFNVKSESYSIIYSLNRQNFMRAIRNSDLDYQFFCVLRDRSEYIVDENNLYLCSICKKDYHNKFECSRLHYVPIRQNCILKYLRKVNSIHQVRIENLKSVKIQISPLKSFKGIRSQQKDFIKQNFDDEHCEEIENLLNFYTKTSNVKELMQSFSYRQNSKMIRNSEKFLDDRAFYKLEEIISNRHREVNFWDLELDEAYNYRYYFEEGNPSNLNNLKRKRNKRSLFNLDF